MQPQITIRLKLPRLNLSKDDRIAIIVFAALGVGFVAACHQWVYPAIISLIGSGQ